MNSTTLFLNFALLCLLAALSNGQCVKLYGQCGGVGYSGPSCCVQPTPLPRYVNPIFDGSNHCFRVNAYYSQCQRRCTGEKPCFSLNAQMCTAPFNGSSDGRGRQYCGPFTACTNPDWCFSDPFSCVCGGDVPCALSTRPGGCRTPGSLFPGIDLCGGGARRCPAFEGEQCGGKGHSAPKSCQPGHKCVKYSKYYRGCVRK